MPLWWVLFCFFREAGDGSKASCAIDQHLREALHYTCARATHARTYCMAGSGVSTRWDFGPAALPCAAIHASKERRRQQPEGDICSLRECPNYSWSFNHSGFGLGGICGVSHKCCDGARLPHLFAFFLATLIVVLSVLSLQIAAKTIIVLLAALSRVIIPDGNMKGHNAAFYHPAVFVLTSRCWFCLCFFCTLQKFWTSILEPMTSHSLLFVSLMFRKSPLLGISLK